MLGFKSEEVKARLKKQHVEEHHYFKSSPDVRVMKEWTAKYVALIRET
jgi:hypothetical protein